MIVAKIYWNTDADGKPVDNDKLEWDDMPQCWYGPFETEKLAMEWLNDWPDDDTDAHEYAVGVVPNDSKHVNDAEEYRGGKTS